MEKTEVPESELINKLNIPDVTKNHKKVKGCGEQNDMRGECISCKNFKVSIDFTEETTDKNKKMKKFKRKPDNKKHSNSGSAYQINTTCKQTLPIRLPKSNELIQVEIPAIVSSRPERR